MNYTVSFAETTLSVGQNYEKGIIKVCPNKAFIVILRKGERLSSPEALQNLVPTIRPRSVLGAFVGLNVSGAVKEATHEYRNYNKLQFNGAYPRYQDLGIILNHLRVFHSDCFKLIPQFNLRTPQGVYFNDRIIFLEIFITMVRNLTGLHDLTEVPHTQRTNWFVKSSS